MTVVTAQPSTKGKGRKSLLFGDHPRAEELAARISSDDARRALSVAFAKRTPNKNAIIHLILWGIDMGFPDGKMGSNQVDLRYIVPGIDRKFALEYDLAEPAGRKKVNNLLQFLQDCRDEIIANLGEIREILQSYMAAQVRKREQVRDEAAIAALPPDQEEITLYGKRAWPRTGDFAGEYDYDQIRAAVWIFRDLLTMCQAGYDNSVASIGIRIRNAMRWWHLFATRYPGPIVRVITLIQAISQAYEANPDAEVKWPTSPKIEGQW